MAKATEGNVRGECSQVERWRGVKARLLTIV